MIKPLETLREPIITTAGKAAKAARFQNAVLMHLMQYKSMIPIRYSEELMEKQCSASSSSCERDRFGMGGGGKCRLKCLIIASRSRISGVAAMRVPMSTVSFLNIGPTAAAERESAGGATAAAERENVGERDSSSAFCLA